MGFIDQVETIIDYLPKNRQTMLFSATMPAEVARLATFYMREDRVSVKMDQSPDNQPRIYQSYIRVSEEKKNDILIDLLTVANPEAAIIFCNTKDVVDDVDAFLAKKGLLVDKLHGGMDQDDRLAVMTDFRSGKIRYLVATDVAARGIDIDHVTHVMNYDVPFENESFIHRTGRTGRAGKEGQAMTLVSDKGAYRWQEVVAFVFEGKEGPVEIQAPSTRVVQRAKVAFDKKNQEPMRPKVARNKELNRDITKVYFNGGKKKKLRAIDFVGTLTNIKGVEADDIGIITIQENVTYVEILNGMGPYVIAEMQDRTIKGKNLKVRKARK
ncbi:helicase-related protein, partial [Jeotgalibaca porci]